MNNKGFTLVELLGTIVILSLVVGISSYSIITVLSNAKKRNYELLIDEIKKASETYYQECVYGNKCPYTEDISLGYLVSNGYLSSNDKASDTKLTNPITKEDISSCTITVKFDEGKGKITVVPKEENDICPSRGDYE